MRFLVTTMLTVVLATVSQAADGAYTLTGENTKIEFTGVKKDGKHVGGFKKLTGTATVPDGKITSGKIELTIEMASLYTDNPGLTGHLKNADFFDVKTNPTSKFVTKSIEADGGKFKVTGDLTMNGKTKSISFPATITATGESYTLAAEFKIDRTQFGMTYGKGNIEDDVAMTVKVEVKN
ncbi:MAG: YceI family protein [Gemmataceae bacterium]